MDKKLRIQYFDKEGRMIQDRMVSQDPEFNAGPKITHKGPMRIEFSLETKEDIERCKVYLDQVIGVLPVLKKKQKVKPEMLTGNDREKFLEGVLENALEDQDKLIQFLRDNGFVFIMWDFLKMFDFPLNIKEKHQDDYQWMIRLLRRAKDPKADKYDPMLLFGIKLLDKRDPKIVIYLDGEFKTIKKVPLPEKPRETFKKSGMMKFPHYMTEEEREKFRREFRQYKDSPEKKISKFYLRWEPYVENIPELPPRVKKG